MEISILTHRKFSDLKGRVRYLDDEILKLNKRACRLKDQNKDVQHRLHATVADREKVKLKTKLLGDAVVDEDKHRPVETGEELRLKNTLLQMLPELIPNAEGLSRSNELIKELFVNYGNSKYRLEKLKQENFDMNNKFSPDEG